MKRIWQRFVGTLPLLLCAAILVATLVSVTPATWRRISDSAVVLAVGLQSPRDSVRYFEHERSTVFASQSNDPLAVPSAFTGELYEASASVIPPKGDGGGAVSEEQLGGGSAAVGRVTVKNNSGIALDYTALWEAGVAFAPPSSDPQVLIVHTHATECYMSYYAGYYNKDDMTRNTDNTQNVTAVGAEIAKELRAAGIGVIHDTTQHDHPEYTGAYTRSEQTIKSYLERYPTIRVVLDIHRDAVMREDLTKVKPTVTVDGQKAAQMMIVVGATDRADRPNPYCEENLRFALRLHDGLEGRGEGLMRPMYIVDARYNQGLTANSLLVEMGTDANTLSEALASGRLLGKQLAAMLAA